MSIHSETQRIVRGNNEHTIEVDALYMYIKFFCT